MCSLQTAKNSKSGPKCFPTGLHHKVHQTRTPKPSHFEVRAMALCRVWHQYVLPWGGYISLYVSFSSCRYATYYPVMLAHNSYKYTLLQGSKLLHCKKRLRSFSLCPSWRGIRRPNKAKLAASTQSDALSGPTPKLKEANTGKILAQLVSGNKTWNRESPSVGGCVRCVNVVVAKVAVKRK